jgi:hypothetical protein
MMADAQSGGDCKRGKKNSDRSRHDDLQRGVFPNAKECPARVLSRQTLPLIGPSRAANRLRQFLLTRHLLVESDAWRSHGPMLLAAFCYTEVD